MEIALNLWYNDSVLRWDYMGQTLEFFADGIEIACVQERYIYVELYKDYQFLYFYISFNNKKVICYNHKKNLISINSKVAICFEEKPHDVCVGNDWNIYVLLNDYKMMLYSENGDYIRSITSPNGYSYYRFFSVEDNISVVCQGNTVNEDCYGRNDWKFTYIENGWIKEGVVY